MVKFFESEANNSKVLLPINNELILIKYGDGCIARYKDCHYELTEPFDLVKLKVLEKVK